MPAAPAKVFTGDPCPEAYNRLSETTTRKMTPEQWRRIEALYHAARERAEPDRSAFLARACAGDDAMQREVESLLAQPASAEGVLDGPAVAVAARMVSDVGASVLTGRRIGAYQVQARLGAGGMGEVYRARDTQLGRDVAIKILPRVFNGNSERLARFDREARMLAALNHPHIGAIYGLEDVDGVAALVLELVDGETLAERLARGPLPVAEALSAARQIAEALNAAHEKGIVHRDLKPANIKITPEGVVKVLDFGLAKVLSGDSAGPDLMPSPTITAGGTREGAILGTAAYMSPEQARGLAVDKRTDIWAFGCVLFEMLTGTAAFPGETISDTFAAILEHEPAWGKLPAAASPAVRRLLERCLEKDPKRRLRDIGDAGMDIDEALLGKSAAGAVAAHRAQGAWLPWTVAAAFVAVSAALAGVVFFGAKAREGASPPRGTKITFTVATPNVQGSLSLSADGTNIADVVLSDTGHVMLWVRALDDQSPPRFLPGTETAQGPFWSPDGRFIGFFAGGKLRTVGISGTPLQTLCDSQNSPGVSGGTWNDDGVIIFAPRPNSGPLYKVPASGGTPVQVTELDQSRQELAHRLPMFLPDGRHFLYTAVSAKADERFVVYVGSLDSKDRKRLINSAAKAVFAQPNHVLFARDGLLMAQSFDPELLELVGHEFPVAEGVGTNPGSSSSFSASKTGVLAYRSGAVTSVVVGRLEWFDRSGKKLAEVGAPATYWSPALSPDLQRIAVHREEGGRDLWIFDLVRGTSSKLTFDPGNDDNPVWSPDGSRIVFSSIPRRA